MHLNAIFVAWRQLELQKSKTILKLSTFLIPTDMNVNIAHLCFTLGMLTGYTYQQNTEIDRKIEKVV